MANLTGRGVQARVEVQFAPLKGGLRRDQATLALRDGEAVKLDLGVFGPDDTGAEIRVAIAEALSGELRFLGATQTIDETE